MDEYQVRTWEGWHHHMVLTLMAVWFLIAETHRGQQLTPALTLPQVRYGLSVLLMEVLDTPGIDSGAESERGVLRRQVPQWLGLPEFRSLVVGFEEAHIGHGGEGALYVRVRRARL